MNKRKIIPLVLALTGVCGLLFYFGYYRPHHNGNGVRTSGHIEVTEVDMSFRLPGHVEKLFVQEGDRVIKGDMIARLKQATLIARRDQAEAQLAELNARRESLELSIQIKESVLDAQVRQAQAGVNAAEARLETLKTGSRTEEIQEAAASLEKARAEMNNRWKDYRRMKSLYDRKIISSSQYEDSRTAFLAAQATYNAVEEKYNMVKIGPRREMIDEGQANLIGSDAALEAAKAGRREVDKLKLDLKALLAQAEQARAALSIADDDLKESSIAAPFDGVVSVKDVEEGEFVQTGAPVLTLMRLDEVWVKTYIPETRLGLVKLGDEADVISDTFPDKKYTGRVTYISPEAEFTPKNVQTREERVKLVYRIKVTIDNPNQELKAGMPVDVVLR